MKNNILKDKIIKGLELTHKRLIHSKKERNQKMVISRNGKIIKIEPSEL